MEFLRRKLSRTTIIEKPQNPLSAKVYQLIRDGNIVHLTGDLNFTGVPAAKSIQDEPDFIPLQEINTVYLNDNLILAYAQSPKDCYARSSAQSTNVVFGYKVKP
jgi:hypothetical protein